jgi:hypothetical protein
MSVTFRVGGLVIDNGNTLSPDSLPLATTEFAGGVIIGTNLSVDKDGILTVASASTSTAGIVQLNNTLTSTSTTQALTANQGRVLKGEIDALAVASNLTFAGSIDASTGFMVIVSTQGAAAGFLVGDTLPTAGPTNLDYYAIVTVPGTMTPPGGSATLCVQGDWWLSSGTQWDFLNLGYDAPVASTSAPGIVQLATDAEVQAGTDTGYAVTSSGLQSKVSDSVSTTSGTTLASSTAVKTAYEAGTQGQADAATAQATANSALPQSGGTMSGDITFHSGQTFPVAGIADATTTSKGVVQVGTNIQVSTGTISVDTADADTLGLLYGYTGSSAAGPGQYNVALGFGANGSITTGLFNVAIGGASGDMTSGSNNVAIGFDCNVADPAGDRQLAIGPDAYTRWLTGDASMNIKPGAGLLDGANSLGTAGQILSSTGTALQWVTNSPDGVLGVTGTTPIQVNNTDPANPVVSIDAASTTASGAVQLNDTTSSTSTTQAATANAVKSAYDLASAALPKAGGTMTGNITFQDAGEGIIFSDASTIDGITDSTNTTDSTVAASATAVNTLRGNAILKSLLTATGDMIYATGVATPTRLAIGTSGQYLTVKSGLPFWTPFPLTGSTGATNTLYGLNTAVTTGTNNTSVGAQAGTTLANGTNNTFVGFQAGDAITGGNGNTIVGSQAFSSANATNNAILGYNAGSGLSTSGNVVIGSGAASTASNTAASIVAIGLSALAANTVGTGTVAVGARALTAMTNATGNTAIGYEAGDTVTTGANNTFVGYTAGDGVTTGSSNTIIGDISGSATLTDNLILAAGSTIKLQVNESNAVGVGSSPSYGTTGQVLTSQGSSAAPTWVTPANGGLPTTGGTMTGNITFSGAGIGILFNDASNITAISDSTSTASSTTAASSSAVKNAYDLANAALPKTGGTMSGAITFNAGQTFPVGGIQSASTTQPGVVQLNNTATSTSTTEALTANQGKLLQDQITALSVSSNITFGGTFNANTGLVDSVTTQGTAAGLVVGNALPAAAPSNAEIFVIVDVTGNTGPSGTPPYHVGDWWLSDGSAWVFLNVGYQPPTATTTQEGVVTLATTAQTQAGTNTSNAVTPSAAAATYLPLAGGAMSGDITLFNQVPPTLSSPASKYYADQIAAGYKPQTAVACATTAAFAGTVTYNNGTAGVGATLTLNTPITTIDAVTITTVGTRILVKNQATTLQNGIYTYTSGGATTVLTRATDANTPSLLPSGAVYYITSGTVNATQTYVQIPTIVAVGTTGITYSLTSTKPFHKYSQEWNVDPIAGDDTNGTGSEEQPFLTIAKALTSAGNTGGRVVLHQGTYNESITIPNLNLDITAANRSGATITGTVTYTGASSSVRIYGVSFTNTITHSSAGGLYIQAYTSTSAINKTGSGYLELDDGAQDSGSLSITGAGYVNVFNCRIGGVTVNNASAIYTAQDISLSGPVTVTTGVAQLISNSVFAATESSNAITAAVGTTVILKNTSLFTPSAVSARMALSGNYSLNDAAFDRINSTLGTNLAGIFRFDSIDNFGPYYANGSAGTSGQFLTSGGAGAATQWVTSGSAPANYGTFLRTNTQTNTGGASGNAVVFDISTPANNFSLTNGGTRITAAVAGKYAVNVSLQAVKTDAGTDDIRFWLKINGANVANSAFNLALQGNNAAQLGTANYIVTLTAGQYVEVWWYSADTDMQLLADPAVAPYPAVPAAIVTVVPVGA